MPEMTPFEAAERIDEHNYNLCCRESSPVYITEALSLAALSLRKIASGEYAPVVHAKWVKRDYEGMLLADCSICNYPISWWHKTPHCPSCGAVMGKDDSYEVD